MRLHEIDFIGKPTPTFRQIQHKHGVSYRALAIQLAKGINVELEHTDDVAIAREIALDHLSEYADYYDRLEKVEMENLNEKAVLSSWITDLSYNRTNNILTMRLSNGKRYTITGIKRSKFEAWTASHSKGTYFHANIDGIYSVNPV